MASAPPVPRVQSLLDTCELGEETTIISELLARLVSYHVKHFNLSTERCGEIQQKGRIILDALQDKGAPVSAFMKSSNQVFQCIFEEVSRISSHGEKLEKCWSQFHSLRVSVLPKLWSDLLNLCGLDSKEQNDRLVFQSLLQAMFERELKKFLSTSATSSTARDPPEITPDEQAIIMWASGYVPLSLIRRYKKSKSSKAVSFVQCLRNMDVGVYEEDFCDYARHWFDINNRGGAFEMNNTAFTLFLQLEQLVRAYLLTLQPHTQANKLDAIVDEIRRDRSVDFHWSKLSVDLSKEDSSELLGEVINLWMTMRGYSIAGAWQEQYKFVTGKHTKQKSSLRKELKKETEQ